MLLLEFGDAVLERIGKGAEPLVLEIELIEVARVAIDIAEQLRKQK